MAHVIAVDEAGSAIVAMVDPASPMSQIPVTAMAKQVNTNPAVFKIPLSWANMVQMNVTLPNAFLTPETKQWLVDQVTARLPSERETLSFTPPTEFHPYYWQIDAATSFARVGSIILSDSPGTGKTASALLGIKERQLRHGDALPALLVVPASVVSNWAKEVEITAPEWTSVKYRGPGRKYNGEDLLITSYDTMNRDEDVLAEIGFQTVVIDEHHMVKNRDAKRTQVLTRLGMKIPLTIALSGTPISHSPADVFATLRVLEPGTFPSYARFEQRYLELVAGDYATTPVGLRQDRAPEFYSSLTGQWRRVDKAEVLSQLPPKVYSTREVEMPSKWRKAYNDMVNSMSADLPEDGGELDVMDTLTQLTVLMSLTLGPGLVELTPNEDPEKPDHIHVRLQEWSWKLPALLEILEERPDQQVLVFSHSRQMIDQATKKLDELGYTTAQIVGGQPLKLRDESVRRFQSGEAQICLATTQAGGVGLTLTAASTVVFMSRPYSLVDAIQSEDRAHRIGSERHESIEIIDVVTTQSIDQAVAAILRTRHASLKDFMSGAASVRALARGEVLDQAPKEDSVAA